MIPKCYKFGNQWVKVPRALVLILRWTLLELLRFQASPTYPGPPHPHFIAPASPRVRGLWAQKPRLLHAGTCRPSGSPAPPCSFSHWLLQMPAPKFHQSTQRPRPLKPGAGGGSAITAGRTSRGGAFEAARRDEFPRSCRRAPPSRSSATGNREPQAGIRARAACVPRLWASPAGFSAPAALSNPLLTLRKSISGNGESQGKCCDLSARPPEGWSWAAGGSLLLARARAGSPGASFERRGKRARGEGIG